MAHRAFDQRSWWGAAPDCRVNLRSSTRRRGFPPFSAGVAVTLHHWDFPVAERLRMAGTEGERSQAARAAARSTPAHFRPDVADDPHQRRRRAAVLALLRGVDGRLLDYGCGYGDLTAAMARARRQTVGVDVDADRIAFARAHYAPLDFRVCGERSLDLPDACFDVVTSVVVLPFVPDVDAYLREAHRVLKPGGHLLLATRTAQWLRRMTWRVRGNGPRPQPNARHLHDHPAAVAAALLGAHGFRIVRRSAIYDPAFSDRRNAADLACGAVELIAARLHWHAASQYPLFLARREDVIRPAPSPHR